MSLSAADKLRLRQGGAPRYVPPVVPEAPGKAVSDVQAGVHTIKGGKPLDEAHSAPVEGLPEPVREDAVPDPGLPAMEDAVSGPEEASDDTVDLQEAAEETGQVPGQKPVEDASVGIRYQRLPPPPPRPKAFGQAKEAKPLSLRVPASLVDMCKRSSGDTAVANSNAVAAFLYAFRDKAYDGIIDYSDISDGIAAFSRTFDVAKERAEFNKRVSDIDRRVRQVSDTQMQLLWSVLYLIWDAAGFRTDHPEDPSDVGFDQDPEGFEILMHQLDKAVSEFAGRVKRKEGRPIR